jgi:hypothetical protein
MHLRLLLLAAALTGAIACTPLADLTQGVAAWPFLLGTEVDVPSLFPLRGAEVFVAVYSFDETYDLAGAPIEDAVVTLSGPGFDDVPVPALGEPGMYGATSFDGSDISYVAGERYRVDILVGTERYSSEATAVEPLVTDLYVDDHPVGERLELPLPADYDQTYSWLLSTAAAASGEHLWSNYPEALEDWVSFAASERTPDAVKVPTGVLDQPGTEYGVSTLGVVRAASVGDAVLSDNLAPAVSGFTAGSGFVVPVWTAP